jgi:hypothetical protein
MKVSSFAFRYKKSPGKLLTPVRFARVRALFFRSCLLRLFALLELGFCCRYIFFEILKGSYRLEIPDSHRLSFF